MTANHPNKPLLVTVQWLRFWAATIVVLSHVFTRVGEIQVRFGLEPIGLKFNGHFGVAVFFVISGFIMVYVSGDEFATRGAPARFISNRIIRIVPVYWVLTLINAGFILFAQMRGASPADRLTLPLLAKSMAFIPYLNFEGKHRPVLEVGWTLNFEMMFYAVFALSLFFARRTGLALCVAIMVTVAGCSLLDPVSEVPGLWCDPIILYFVAGIGLALIREALLKLGAMIALPMPLFLTFILLAPFAVTWHSPFTAVMQPIVTVLVVALATLGVDAKLTGERRSFIVTLGNISYGVYLAHGFALLLIGILWRKLFGAGMMPLYVVTATAGSIATGYLCFRYIERPLTRWLKAVKFAKEPAI